MDLIYNTLSNNKKPLSNIYLPISSQKERQRARYFAFISDASKLAKSVMHDYIDFNIKQKTSTYLGKIGNDDRIDDEIDSFEYIDELLENFLHDIGKMFNIPHFDYKNGSNEEFRTFLNKHLKLTFETHI